MSDTKETAVRFRVDPDPERDTRPTYDVIDGDSYDHIVGSVTHAEATFIASVLNGEVTADDLEPGTWWEYGIMRPGFMPAMSGETQWVQIVGSTFRDREQAEQARRQAPSLRGVPATICRRRVSAWEEARDA